MKFCRKACKNGQHPPAAPPPAGEWDTCEALASSDDVFKFFARGAELTELTSLWKHVEDIMQVGGWPLERRRDGVVVPGGVGEPAMPSGRHGALARGCPTPRQARLRLVVRRPARGPAAAWSFFSRHRRQGEAAGGGTWSCVGGPYAAQPAQTARPRRPCRQT